MFLPVELMYPLSMSTKWKSKSKSYVPIKDTEFKKWPLGHRILSSVCGSARPIVHRSTTVLEAAAGGACAAFLPRRIKLNSRMQRRPHPWLCSGRRRNAAAVVAVAWRVAATRFECNAPSFTLSVTAFIIYHCQRQWFHLTHVWSYVRVNSTKWCLLASRQIRPYNKLKICSFIRTYVHTQELRLTACYQRALPWLETLHIVSSFWFSHLFIWIWEKDAHFESLWLSSQSGR